MVFSDFRPSLFQTSLFSALPSPRFKRVPALSPSLSLFSPPRHYFPSLRFFSLSAPLFSLSFSVSRLVPSRFLPSAPTVSEIFGGLCGNFSMEERNERRGEKREREREKREGEFLWILPRPSYFFPLIAFLFPWNA